MAEVLEPLDVAGLALPLADPRDDLEHALGADATRRALAARLLLDELEEEPSDVDHAAVLVHDDEAARAHDRAELLQGVVVDGDVQVLGGDAAARRATHLCSLELLAARDPPSDVEHDLAERHADRDLDETGVLDRAGERKHLRALALGRPHRGVPLRPAEHDHGDGGEGLDVVQAARAAPQARLGRIGRARTRLAAMTLDRGHERGLLAADEGPGADPDLEVEVEASTEDVLAQEAALARLLDRLAQALDGERVLGADVDVSLPDADREGADRHPLDDAVGVALQDAAVHEGAGIALVAVAEDVLHVARRATCERPLDSGGEARAATPTQPGGLHRVDDLLRGHLAEHPREGGVAVLCDVLLDGERVDHAAVPEDDLDLLLEEGA